MILQLTLEAAKGQRLDTALAGAMSRHESLGGVSRSQISLWIERGRVKVDGRIETKPARRLKGPVLVLVEIVEEAGSIEPCTLALDILYEDPDLLVLNKPAKLSMHPGAGQKQGTLLNALIGHFHQTGQAAPELWRKMPTLVQGICHRPGIVHRLDRDTTGIVVVAKTLRAQASLGRQFAEHAVERAYMALVFCTPRGRRIVNRQDSGVVDAALGRDPRNRTRIAIEKVGGRRAVTHWRVLERFGYGCLVELRLETGRTHQIRVHMTSLGSPVIGDKSYGDFSGLPKPLKDLQARFGRQALHAYKLAFSHPADSRPMSFSSQVPRDMQLLIDGFRDYGR